MSSVTPRRGLRTKTGCLTCRNRRKKCDERNPICKLCRLSGRQCVWPTSADLLDRRYASHHRSRHCTSPPPSPVEFARPSNDKSALQTICILSEATAHREVIHNLEMVISRHFIDKYYGLLLLPNCHPEFYHGWITEIQYLMVEHKGLYYSVLANAASHLHFIDDSSRMQELALTYYSNALRGLSSLLTQASQLENHNGLLMSVMLLYLHGCMGRGTYTDIPRHVNAATRILTLRLFNRPLRISRPFDRLAIESVLYQIFLVTTGLWSDEIRLDYVFDTAFWVQAEKVLDQNNLFPGQSISFNSPVLGVPVALFRLAISMKQHYQSPARPDQTKLESLRDEVEEWEAIVLNDVEPDSLSVLDEPNPKRIYYKDASYLYILITSLLLEQLSNRPTATSNTNTFSDTEGQTDSTRRFPRLASRNCWQIAKAIEILRRHDNDDEWKICFLGNWPTYTLGFFMSEAEDVELVRKEMEKRWELTKFSQLARYGNDLERFWSEKGLSSHRLVEIESYS